MFWWWITAALLAAHLAAGRGTIATATKTAASVIFVILAYHRGVTASGWGWWLFVALVLSAIGDIFLTSRRPAMVQAGILAFMLGHGAYSCAFHMRGTSTLALILALLVLVKPAMLLTFWVEAAMSKDVKLRDMRPLVRVYAGAVTAMLALAFATAVDMGNWRIPGAAALFWISDITVARDLFVKPGIENRVVGLPMYYAAQLLFALYS